MATGCLLKMRMVCNLSKLDFKEMLISDMSMNVDMCTLLNINSIKTV